MVSGETLKEDDTTLCYLIVGPCRGVLTRQNYGTIRFAKCEKRITYSSKETDGETDRITIVSPFASGIASSLKRFARKWTKKSRILWLFTLKLRATDFSKKQTMKQTEARYDMHCRNLCL
jgi:hypothetical protein